MAQVYLDHAATTHLRPDSRAALIAALDVLGNPASIHTDGQRARQLLEDSREQGAGAGGGGRLGGGWGHPGLRLFSPAVEPSRSILLSRDCGGAGDRAPNGCSWLRVNTTRPSTPWRGWPLTRGPVWRGSGSMRWVECGWRHSMRHWLTRDRSRS